MHDHHHDNVDIDERCTCYRCSSPALPTSLSPPLLLLVPRGITPTSTSSREQSELPPSSQSSVPGHANPFGVRERGPAPLRWSMEQPHAGLALAWLVPVLAYQAASENQVSIGATYHAQRGRARWFGPAVCRCFYATLVLLSLPALAHIPCIASSWTVVWFTGMQLSPTRLA
ncbi:hypothetical protein CALVIDRAFT_535214 [Calocera viscosa TUFC12733]|uniref:Uncharacterized protein n=1 Tax=Calocera viscosa (strain TUFC12733) TaxID=1330018 RepID=A0A167PAI0_CALVF|nr:hypothetical protein CALVIDRAFT_535214 [Calocera viscosa TUFC12733]